MVKPRAEESLLSDPEKSLRSDPWSPCCGGELRVFPLDGDPPCRRGRALYKLYRRGKPAETRNGKTHTRINGKKKGKWPKPVFVPRLFLAAAKLYTPIPPLNLKP